MDELKVAIIQTPIIWEDAQANRKMLDKKLETLKTGIDLIVLPETFTTGFAMKNVSTLAEGMDGPTVKWMKNHAKEKDACICGSIMIQEDQLFYNRLLWVKPNGQIETYDKRHLFRLAYEQNYFSPGEELKTLDLKDWKIRLNICYDLRFPVWCRINNNDYDALLFIANWPEPRNKHWCKLIEARAIENLSYVIACNRVGIDGTGKNHTGDSAVIAPTGDILIQSNQEEILYATLEKTKLKSTRSRFQFYKDADLFQLDK